MSTHQVLIASYEKDFVWLGPCLASLRKFSQGFLSPAISVTEKDYAGAKLVIDRNFPEAIITVDQDPRGIEHGNLRAQVAMMHGDALCPDADYIWLVGSDCVVSSTFSPDAFFHNGKPVMLMNSYEHLFRHVPRECIIPWQLGVEKALGISPNYEYMRRLPLMYPSELFARTRDFISSKHNCSFKDYVYNVSMNTELNERSDSSNFSESNVLGAYAHHFKPDLFQWVCLDDYHDPISNPMIQFWSHGGLDFPCDCRFDYPGGTTFGKTPREIITHILGPDAFA